MSSTHRSQEVLPFAQQSSQQPQSSSSTASTNIVQKDFSAIETTSDTDSHDSKLRPLKVGDLSQAPNTKPQSVEPPFTKVKDLRVSSKSPLREHSGVLGGVRLKSDSLDSSRAACCTNLAFNFYNKAVESAKKALPKHKSKEYPHFPRSFGEDFGSIGPDAFNYLDDSMTECSVSYKDIDFNRDSYYGAEVIPEEAAEVGQLKMDEEKPAENLVGGIGSDPPEPMPYPGPVYGNPYNPAYYFNEPSGSGDSKKDQPPSSEEKEKDFVKAGSEDAEENKRQLQREMFGGAVSTESLEDGKQKKASFIGKIFRKRDRSVDKDSGANKENKKEKAKSGKSSKKSSASQSRECSMDKSRESSRGRSLPPKGNEPVEDTERSLIDELDRRGRTPSPSPGRLDNENVMHFSNISRQSPVNIVYTRPPDIFVEEVRTLPRDTDELASHTSQMILADVLNSMNSNNNNSGSGSASPVTYANLDFSGAEEFAVAPGAVVGKDGKPKKDFKAVILPKGFFRKLSGKGKSPGPSEGSSGEPTGPVVIVVDDVVASVVNGPPFQTEEELLGKPLPDLPGSSKSHKTSGDGAKPKARLFLKKENFKLKDRFKKKKKQKDSMQEAVARRQLPTLPESKHSTLNSGGGGSHLYDRIGLTSADTPTAERRQLQTDEYGNVLLDIGKPIEPGVDYFSPEYAPEEPEEEEEVFPKSSSLYAQQPPELKSSYESLELPATTKPASPPPKVIDVEAKTGEAGFDPTTIAFDSPHPIIIGQIALFEKMENVADREIGVTYEPAVIEFLEPPEEHDIGGSGSGKPGKMDKLKNMMGSLGQSVRAKVKDIKEKVKKHDHEQQQQQEYEGHADQFEQNFARVSKSPHRDPYVMVDVMPTLKETNLDEEFPNSGGADHYIVQQQQQSSSFSFRTFAPIAEETASAMGTLPPPPESPVKITVEEVPTTTEVVAYEVDADLEEAAVDMTPEMRKKKKVFRKFKLTKKGGKKSSSEPVEETIEYVERRDVITPDRNEYALRPIEFDDEEEEKPSWSARNKERIRRLRARAAESFKGVKERIAVQAGKLGGKKSPDARQQQHQHDPEAYEYEFKFASDSEQAGLDARQQKVYKDLAEAQERLEMYMSPVGARGPLRPPRSNAVKQYSPKPLQSSVSMSGRKLPPPPRPPPPKRLPGGSYPLHSYHSVPAIEVGGEGDEISLSTSMSSLWAAGRAASNARSARSRSVRAANRHYQQQQRVPAEIYYRNVRLGYRPKKSYVELLEKSVPFYSVANLNRSFSLGQLPVPPTRNKYKQQQQQQSGQYLTARSIRATTSPPPPPSRASMASGNYGELPGGALARHGRAVTIEPVELDADLLREKELYEVYDHHNRPRSPPAADGAEGGGGSSAPADPLAWQPFSWKVKRCRSLTEIDVRGEARMKQARCSVEPPDDDPRNANQGTSENKAGEENEQTKENPEETYSSRLLSWLTSTTSLDTWRRVKRDRSVPSKPPRPPLPSGQAKATFSSSRPSSPTASSSAVAFYYPSSITDASRSSSVATLTQQSAATITGYPNSASTNHTHPHLHSAPSHFTGRPLPPPPVPPRPRLIPAHYALNHRPKAVETRDAAVDTSENGFHDYHLSEKEVQVKLGLAARTPGHSLLSSFSQGSSADSADLNGLPPVATAALRSFEETNLDDDEEPTIIDDKAVLTSRQPNTLPSSNDFSEYSVKDDEISEEVPEEDANRADTLNTATSASVYEDARSRLTGQLTTTTSQRVKAANHVATGAGHNDGAPQPYELSDNDDDTINDELSSFASEYQSFCSSLRSEAPHSTGAGVAPFAEPEPGLSPVPPPPSSSSISWLHRQQPPSTTGQPAQQSASTDKHSAIAPGGNNNSSIITTTATTEEEYLTAMDGPNAASNRSSLISNDPMLEMDELEEAPPAAGMSFDDFRRTFANSMVISGVADEEEGDGGAAVAAAGGHQFRQSSPDLEDGGASGRTAAASAAANTNASGSGGQAMSADAKRFNRQSVISTISSASSDTSSSIFHTHSSSPTSSYSFDSSASLTSIPQAHISSIASTSTSTSTSKRSSVFYTNVTAPISAVEAAEEAMQSESEVTRTSDLGTSVASSSVTIATAESGQTLVEDGCVPSKASTSATSLGEVVVLSPSPRSLPENLSRLPSATPKGSEPTKEYYLAYEMWLTERDYVDVLQMLTKEFREAVQGTVNGYFLNKFFRPLDQVLPINERLLKELEQRVLVDWDDNPKISDIMIKICPFFKEYSIFVREFDQLNHMLDEAAEMFPDFSAALTAFQRTDRCKKLSIKNYLLKPIQRLPQYPLLITTYLKKLKSDDADYENTQRALRVVTEVVEHVNRESHQAEKALKLAELKNRIIAKTPDAIVKPGRELIKEGPLQKISRKEVQERYFILFNDALLYLVPVMNDMIRLNEEFPLDGMEVDISIQSEREFVIRSMRRSFALMARSKEERAAWVEALEGAIAENDAKKNSFETARGHSNSCGNSSSYSSLDRRSSSPHRSSSRLQDSFSSDHHHHPHHHPHDLEHSPSMSSTDDHPSSAEGHHHQSLHHQPSSASTTSSSSIERRNTNPNNAVSTLGERAPVWVHDHRVSMCQGCMREFTMFFRRHHCRACGAVVCSDCSGHHYPLRYRKMEPQRVCDNCYEKLSTLHPEWLNGGVGSGGGAGGNGTGNGTPTGSNRVSPNNSLSTADLVALKRKSRSNSCTHLDDSFKWTDPENGGLHNQSLPVDGGIFEQDQNHNPTTAGSLFSPPSLVRGPIRFSSRFARKNIPAVLVEVQANDASCKQSGFMYRLSTKKSWKRFWFVIKEMVLYTYRASEDVAALNSLPLPGFKVATAKEAIKGYPAGLIIELSHPGQSTIYFFTENPEAHQRWLKAFRECAELH